MAQIHEEIVVIKLSKLVREQDECVTHLVNDEFIDTLEEVAQELLTSDIIVEVERK